MQDGYNLHVYLHYKIYEKVYILSPIFCPFIFLCNFVKFSDEYYSGGYYASPEDAYTYTAHAQHVLSSSPTAHAPHGLSSSAHAQHLLSSSPTAHGLSSSAHAQHLLSSSSPYHNGEDMRASASQLYRDAVEQQNCSVLAQKKMHRYADSFNFLCGYGQCYGSGSESGPVCFWANRIRIH
jgi:hypothetical protein